jgi:hypothetical protein
MEAQYRGRMASGDLGDDPVALLATARALETDRVTAEVVSRFAQLGIDALLIKGPTLATWLYADGDVRPYVDSDLMVPPDAFQRAEAALVDLGFQIDPAEPDTLPDHGIPHAETFRRAGSPAIDLHRAPSGASVAPSTAWKVLSEHSESMLIGGLDVRVPTPPARALICAFHAAQHGSGVAKPLEDLRRAVACPKAIWDEAVEIAARLGGIPSLVVGLRMTPAGAALADELGLPSARLAESAISPDSRARLALGFDRLAQQQGIRAKAFMLMNELFPEPDFMRWRSPLARRGPFGLVMAYVRRAGWLFTRLGASVALWRRDRALSRDSTS